jgi:hypothetical protein
VCQGFFNKTAIGVQSKFSWISYRASELYAIISWAEGYLWYTWNFCMFTSRRGWRICHRPRNLHRTRC